jgi:predicted flap endonuclease-1-like 5' DNA nuclease
MNWKIVVAFLLGGLLAWLLGMWGMRKGKKYEEVYDRVVEDTTDESTKIRTLTDSHALALKGHDETLAKLRDDHEVGLLRAKVDHDTALSAQKAELGKLQTMVWSSDSVKSEVETTKLQMQQQKDEFARLELDWKKRLEAAEASATASGAKIRDLEANHLKLVADTDAKATLVTANGSEWEAKYTALDADWQAKFDALEVEHKNCATQIRNLSSETSSSGGALPLVGAVAVASAAVGAAGAVASTRPTGSPTPPDAAVKSMMKPVAVDGDDLLLIEGIGPKVNQVLNQAGITKWSQIRDTDEATLQSILDKGGVSYSHSVPTWSKQATFLCDGDQPGFYAYIEYLDNGREPEGSTPEKIRSYIDSARPRMEQKLGNAPAPKDDLTELEGVGPKFNDALLNAGINTFAKVAESSEEKLTAALTDDGLTFAPSLPTWPKQAGLLAKGDRQGFEAYVATLRSGVDS